jgi:SAM-dependent methyltransferase
MRFTSLRRHWERLGRNDPYWAVLTNPEKRGGRWDVAEFFRSGVDEIESVLDRATELGTAPARGRALDFGCGAGRLTQAMAQHFDACDGVDISTSMLQIARQHNRFADRCTYHLNPAPDLRLFPSGTFDFAYSTLVLQHMEPRYSMHYVGELLRVMAPAGLLVFQLPSQRSTLQPPAEARRTAIPGRMPREAFQAHLTSEQSSFSCAPGQTVTLNVIVENRSPHTWPCLPDSGGRRQITVGNHWLNDDHVVARRDDGRCPLPHDLPPGASTSVMLVVTAPKEDGVYELELDLVQEEVAWFSERGSSTLRLPCVVSGGVAPAARARQPEAVAPQPPAPREPFRHRHPRAFAIMRATGVRDVYWAWRRAMDRVFTARDRAIVALRERLRVGRLVNWWRGKPFAARMEMHCVPRAEVLSIVEGAGGRLVHVEEEWTPGFLSCRYWIVKDPD